MPLSTQDIPCSPTPILPILGQKVEFHLLIKKTKTFLAVLSTSLNRNAPIDANYNNNTIFSNHHHGNSFFLFPLLTDMGLIPKYHFTKANFRMSLRHSFDAQISFCKE